MSRRVRSPPCSVTGLDMNGTKQEPVFLFDGLASSIFTVDCYGCITGWNRKLEETTGWSSKDLRSRSFAVLLEKNSHKTWDHALQVGLRGQSRCNIDIRCKGGPILPFTVKITAQSSPEGDLIGAACFVEETICRSPACLSWLWSARDDFGGDIFHEGSLLETSPNSLDTSANDSVLKLPIDRVTIPIFTVDSECVITQWNKSMCILLGYEEEEIVGKSVLSCCGSSDSRDKFKAITRKSMQGVESREHVLLQDRYRKSLNVSVSSCLVEDINGLSKGVAFLCQDLTIEYDETNASCELQSMLDNANFPVIALDMHGCIISWNKDIASISCVTEKDALGRNFAKEFIRLPIRKSVQAVLDASTSGTLTRSYELEVCCHRQRVRYFLANVMPWKDYNGDIIGTMIIAQDVTEAAQHDRAMAAMAQELRRLIDTANNPIFGIDRMGRINEWNDKVAEITGFTADEAFNIVFVDKFVPDGQRDTVRSMIEGAIDGRGTANFELEIRTKTNEIRYLLMNPAVRRDVENAVVGVLCIALDVTEASKHDRAVAAMASELRQLIDTANAPIFGIDCDGDVNEWNDKTAEITGYTKEEAFDSPLVQTFIVPSMQESVQEVLDSAIQGRGTSNYELEFRTKSNEIRHLLVNATTRRDAENNVVGVVGVAQDITEAVQRDRAVAGMALELRQLIDTANAPIFGIDIDGNVNEWNRRTQEITGFSKEETFDEPLVERFIAPHMRERVQDVLDAALQGNETSNYELEFISKSGDSRFLLVNATTRRDPEFNVVGVVGVAQDVTEDRKHAVELRKMQYLQATQDAKVETERNMTAYFAHELRNPLGAIDSALSAMPDDISESAKSLVSGMQLCTSFMSSIMNNLLDVRKMEEGKMILNKRPISLEKLITRVHKMLLPAAKSGVSFSKVAKTSGRDWVLGDEHRIQQVLTNVITNAIKYTISGSIEILIGWEDGNVKFECTDSGPGIPTCEQEKLFQRFVQRGGAPGTGLGLAIAKHLVDLTGGSIRFDSDPTIKPGTTCIVLMPLELCEPPGNEIEEEQVALIEEPLRFLVIDDVRMNRLMLKRRIQKGIAPNCTLREASTGERALEICALETFDVIIVDQYMEEAGGVMVGTDVVYAMRRMRIKSIIIGCSGNDLNEEFREAGADWVWQKPIPSNASIICHLREGLAKRAKENWQ